MDGAHKNTTRKFPAYSLGELKKWLAAAQGTPLQGSDTEKEIISEITRRESGESKMFVVPQF